MAVKVGDLVQCSAQTDIYGTHLASFVRTSTYKVLKVDNNKITIGQNGVTTAVVYENTVSVMGGNNKQTTQPTKTPNVPVKPVEVKNESSIDSSGLISDLTNLINSQNSKDVYKYSMRLFGIPHQFTQYCDYRTYSEDNKASKIGRKFIENIMLEAPVVTILPGKPSYLPAAKDKQSTSLSLLTNANESASSLIPNSLLTDKNLNDKLRYYDFEGDYLTFIKYANILCASGAAFLDLQDVYLDGSDVPLTKYDWKNYRWTAEKYGLASLNMLSSAGSAAKNIVKGAVNTIKTFGKAGYNAISGVGKTSKNPTIVAFDDTEDKSLLESLEDVGMQTNFIQFYVDASSGMSESNDNNTSPSKLEGIMSSGNELFKEVAFLANTGGIDANSVTSMAGDAVDALNAQLTGDSNGAIAGIMSRLMSATTNVIQGETMIFPEIYQNSSYNKSYSVSVDLRTPYGDKLSYYLNVLVPLFHLIALSVPKQTTANTYGSPFIIKAYMPGIFSCNLGIIKSIEITKNPNNDAWTADGFPSEIRVTLNITDLYSDLTLTPAGDITLFLANTSLIEYIATNCGVNLTTPQLANRVKMITNAVSQAIESIDETIAIEAFGGLENLIAGIMGV